MELKLVESSQIDAMGWKDNMMIVRFKTGAVYIYENVPQELFESISTAPSVGHALNESLKYKPEYPCTKLSK